MTMTFTEGTMYAALLLPSFAFFLSVSARPARGCSAAGTFLADTRPRSTWGCSPCPCC